MNAKEHTECSLTRKLKRLRGLMCGITGFVGFEDKSLIHKMTDMIAHRGPDDSGYFIGKNICLGHRRLSIIDVSAGKQPMYNEDDSICIVFNGEIYNYSALSEELKRKGHKFRTNSDTETIIHAYEEYGDNCVKHLRGMFAFAIWDNSTRKKLFLARDRLGIKPLYYALINGSIVFASEIKAILLHPDIKRKVDNEALYSYLTFGYVPAPRTMFSGICKLPPASTLSFKDGRYEIKQYWDVTFKETEGSEERQLGNSGSRWSDDEEHYKAELLRILKESVRSHLMSEVPLGAFLSGGLDSSTVVALMSSAAEEPIKTISAGFESGGYYDELKYARIVAEHFNTDHHEVVLKANDLKILPKIVWHFDEPVPDPSSVPEYLISQKAKKYVTVALVGEGSDELFMGYRQYKIMSMAYAPVIRNMLMHAPVGKVASLFGRAPVPRIAKRYMEVAAGISKSINSPKDCYMGLVSSFSPEERSSILANPKSGFSESILGGYFAGNGTIFDKMSKFELSVPLADMLLMNVDKMTMANAIEARVPFLDHKLVEFSANIPCSLKLYRFNEKYLLKKAMSGILPKEILKRKKHPFAVPVRNWLEGELKDRMLDVLSRERIEKQGYFKYPYIKKLIDGKKYNQLWPLTFFEMWHEIFIEDSKFNRGTI
ncbi:Glutamine--fructose-6-phosphate aminotransferase [isomerizing] [uncultured archaeon]|nr:Glutamine--fructose-6-phosphate aminotransferase [isomerizing] [uncultured archaeon]